MEKETIVPSGKEMNFFDLCVAFGRAIGRGCKAFMRLLEHMLHLTYRYWWLVMTFIVLAVAAALYYTRKDNLTFKVNAVALLNGPSIQQFEQAYAPLRANKLLPKEAPVYPLVHEGQVRAFETYRVIDCLHDGEMDFVDFKRKSSPTDTVKVQMQDRLCLQFRIKNRDMNLVPEIEHAMLAFLNADPAMQHSYVSYFANLREQVIFNHHQAQKLDSLTSAYYFYTASPASPMNYSGNGVNFYGDRRIKLFLDEIYKHQKHMQQVDYRMQLATAPVVLENHFSVDAKPVNGRIKILFIFCLMAWIGGCALAELIDKRKAICAWLKQ